MQPQQHREDSALRHALDEANALRDKVQVRTHLMSMEARERWKQAEGKLRDLEQQAEREGTKVADTVIGKAREISARFKELLREHQQH